MDLTLLQDFLPLPCEGTSSTSPSSPTQGSGAGGYTSLLPTVTCGENDTIPGKVELGQAQGGRRHPVPEKGVSP